MTPIECVDLLISRVAAAAADTELHGRRNRTIRVLGAVWCKTLLYGKVSDTCALSQLEDYCGLTTGRISEELVRLAERGHIKYQPGTPSAHGQPSTSGTIVVPTGLVETPAAPPVLCRDSKANMALATCRHIVQAVVNRTPASDKQCQPWLMLWSTMAHLAAAGGEILVEQVSQIADLVGLYEAPSGDGVELKRSQERAKKARARGRDRLEYLFSGNDSPLQLSAGDPSGRRVTGRNAVMTMEPARPLAWLVQSVLDKKPVDESFRDAVLSAAPIRQPKVLSDETVSTGVPPSADRDSGAWQPPLMASVSDTHLEGGESGPDEQDTVADGVPPSLSAVGSSQRDDLVVAEQVEAYWRGRDKTTWIAVRVAWSGRGLRAAVQRAVKEGATRSELLQAMTADVREGTEADPVSLMLSGVERVRGRAVLRQRLTGPVELRGGLRTSGA